MRSWHQLQTPVHSPARLQAPLQEPTWAPGGLRSLRGAGAGRARRRQPGVPKGGRARGWALRDELRWPGLPSPQTVRAPRPRPRHPQMRTSPDRRCFRGQARGSRPPQTTRPGRGGWREGGRGFPGELPLSSKLPGTPDPSQDSPGSDPAPRLLPTPTPKHRPTHHLSQPGLPGVHPLTWSDLAGALGRAAPPGRSGGQGEEVWGGADRGCHRNRPGRNRRAPGARRRSRPPGRVCVEEPGLGVGAAGEGGGGARAGRATGREGRAAQGHPGRRPRHPGGPRDPARRPAGVSAPGRLGSSRPAGAALLTCLERRALLPSPRFPAGIWGSGLGGAGAELQPRAGLPSGPGPGCRVTRSPAGLQGARASGAPYPPPPSPERPGRSVLSGLGARCPDSRGPEPGPA